MNVLVLSRYDRLGSTSRLRILQYLPYLYARGFNVSVSPFLSDAYLNDLYGGKGRRMPAIFAAYARRIGALKSAARFDLVWIEKEILPWLPASAERWLNRRRIPYIVDYDDATFHNYDQNRSRLIRRALGLKIDEVMRGASIVVAGNEYLANHARRAGAARVEIVPTVVDLDRYTVAGSGAAESFTVGWIGTPVTAPYLHLIESSLAEVCRAGNARLVTVGSGNIRLPGVQHEIRPWSEQTETTEVQSFDCGIMPLPDEDWERGKCGYKLIQYMACGLPVVASPVGVNREIVEHGVNGYLATGRMEWIDTLISLRDDYELRKHMGSTSRIRVEQQYCLNVTAPRMLTLLVSALR